jgi:hypothetical protein
MTQEQEPFTIMAENRKLLTRVAYLERFISQKGLSLDEETESDLHPIVAAADQGLAGASNRESGRNLPFERLHPSAERTDPESGEAYRESEDADSGIRNLDRDIKAALSRHSGGNRTPREAELESLLWQALTCLTVLRKKGTLEVGQLRQQLKWRDQLDAVPATVMSQNQKAALKVTLQDIQHKAPDADGLVQIESWHLCKKAGMSKGTFLDHLAYCADLGILRKHTEQVRDPDSQQVIATNYFVGTTELTAQPYKYQALKPRNHGGARPCCKNPACRSERLQKRTIKRTIVVCLDCGEVQSDETSDQTVMLNDSLDSQVDDAAASPVVESTLEQQDKHHASDQNVNLTTIKTNVLNSQVDDAALPQQEPATPPDVATLSTPSDEQHRVMTMSQADVLAQAAQLLLEIAGPEPVHIEMSSRGPKKYYDVAGAITVQDTLAHLKGWKTKGAYLRRPDGLTRALCYDADTQEDWEHLLDAARLLAEAGYLPLVEDSPVKDGTHIGGHLWMIYTRLVNAAAAQQQALQVAPMLQYIKEAWPGPGGNKVRLPGGKYVKLGFAAWCKLHDAHGARIAEDGPGAARALLAYQTPAEIVPEYSKPEDVAQRASSLEGCSVLCQAGPEPCGTPARHPGELAILPNSQDEKRNAQPLRNTPGAGLDQQWHEKYNRHLWFQFTPAQLATWYNKRHQVEDILPPEENGMGLASWRGEHTASVGLREDGWVDFGASARRNDGKQDGGDAFELTVRVKEEPKPEVMRQAARQLVSEAREAMESAAQHGEQPPQWVQAFMSPAGWERYHQLCEEAGHCDQAITASPEPAPHTGGVDGSCETSALAAPSSLPAPETLEAFAAEIGATIGEPCEKCGCTLYRHMAEYQVCIRCYPPRGYHVYSGRVDAFFPKNT